MTPFYAQDGITLYHGDCRDVLPELEGFSSVVTDPPYGIGFMGKEWDHGVPGPEFWRLIAAACLPGAPLFAFGGTRTYHRLVCGIEDAGWQIRDCLQWIYGSGFPKSLDISKAIDKAAGAEREVTGLMGKCGMKTAAENYLDNKKWSGLQKHTAATAAAKQWDGWGTALKPAYEPICLAMKPIPGTFAENALECGVAGLWIDGARVGEGETRNNRARSHFANIGGKQELGEPYTTGSDKGRWPANIIHDGSPEVLVVFPEVTTGSLRGDEHKNGHKGRHTYGTYNGYTGSPSLGDTGSAARFFYCAKPSQAERGSGNDHPTVKPLTLLTYLLRLSQTPTGGVVLDPFAGSGSTLVAAKRLGRDAVGIELEERACEVAAERLKAERQGVLRL